jgi:hypothetical protein
VAGSLQRFAVIEPAVESVHSGWTIEPLNRRPHRFDCRSGSNNYALNTSQGKGKQVMDDSEGPSSRFKKKKKKDKHRRDDNLVAAVEHKATRPKNNPPRMLPEGPFRKALGGTVHPPRDARQACAQACSQSSARPRLIGPKILKQR